MRHEPVERDAALADALRAAAGNSPDAGVDWESLRRRIGRALSVVGVVILSLWLLIQLGIL